MPGRYGRSAILPKGMYLLDYGMTYVDGMAVIVSNGNGFWGPPVRMGPYPEIVVINVKQAG